MTADLFAREIRASVVTVEAPARALDAEAFRRALAEKRCAVCGSPAHFGFGVSARMGRLGQWFCARHVRDGRAQ